MSEKKYVESNSLSCLVGFCELMVLTDRKCVATMNRSDFLSSTESVYKLKGQTECVSPAASSGTSINSTARHYE